MKKNLIVISTFLLITISNVFSQGEAAVPFINIQPGPNLNAMAGAFAALPSTDAFGQYFNPAQLGNFGRKRNISYQFYTHKTQWLPVFNDYDLTLRSSALAIGYTLKNIFQNVPVSIGMGYIDTHLNLGEDVWTDENGDYLGTFHSKERYAAYSIGIGIDYYVRLNIGYTFKKIHSKLGMSDAKANAEDVGFQLTLPLIRTIDTFRGKPFVFADGAIPFFDISLGLAQSNKGKKVRYISGNQGDPLPKQAKIGYAISFGLSKEYHASKVGLVKFDWSSEARDILVHRDDYGKRNNTTFPGEIEIWDNVLQGKSNEQITVYHGWRIKLLDIFQYSQGRFKGPGYPTFQRTHGFLFSTTGLLQWLNVNYDWSVLKYAVKHFELCYMGTRYTADSPLNDIEFSAISLSIFGF
ncbi:MAG: hypothetical protein GF313_12950 [Caldithrix sp.]|nr:hypothetical protein [Caldithrix sp.]